jgi:hypothetical protein
MGSAFERRALEEAPLYIRWNPDRSFFAVEMKLELVGRIWREIAYATRLNQETGGILVGSLPSNTIPTLRIDDVLMVPRETGDGQVFMLNPAEHERFAQVRWHGVPGEKTAVGFFRSHLRSGPLKPSIADRGLLSEHFRNIHVLLLIEGREPRRAAFFLATNGEVPDVPSIREFRFDEEEFRSLPEVEPEQTPEPEHVPARQIRQWAILFAASLLICAALVWSLHGDGLGRIWERSADVKLSIQGTGAVLTISWNHAAREIAEAHGAILIIRDGASRREIELGEDDLLLGVVEYRRNSQRVEATLSLKTANGAAPQTAEWQASP